MDFSVFLAISQNPLLVFLAWAVAIFTAYTALDLIDRVSQTNRLGSGWFVSGSLAFGMGIWAMLYIFLSALPIGGAIAFNPVFAFASFLLASLGAAAAMYMLGLVKPNFGQILLGSLMFFAGLGGALHTGLFSVKAQAALSYDSNSLIVSLAVLLTLSIVGFWVVSTPFFRKIPARTVILALATGSMLFINGMMAINASRFNATSTAVDATLFDGTALAVKILITLAIVLMALPLFASSLVQSSDDLSTQEVEQ